MPAAKSQKQPPPEWQDLLPAWRREAAVTGFALAVVAEGRVAWSAGEGRKRAERPDPITADTVFEAASLSKPLFAAGVLALVERGVLDLDAPLADYLPEPYLTAEPRLPLITARRALCHTSGLPNWRASGKPLARPPMEEANAAYSLYTTAPDMARYLAALCAAPEESALPLSADSRALLAETAVTAAENVGWSLGWGTQRTAAGQALWQWGDNPGFKGLAMVVPASGRGVVYLSNAHDGSRLWRPLLSALFGDELPVYGWMPRYFSEDWRREH